MFCFGECPHSGMRWEGLELAWHVACDLMQPVDTRAALTSHATTGDMTCDGSSRDMTCDATSVMQPVETRAVMI